MIIYRGSYNFMLALLCCLIPMINGCTPGFSSERDMHAWMNDESNGFIRTKVINGIKISVKYLPAEYLVYKEMKTYPKQDVSSHDSLLNWYKHNHTFVMNISFDKEKITETDIMKLGVSNYEEYREKFLTMNFEMAQYISLHVRDNEVAPVLANLENVYGLTNDRNINLVFSKEQLPSDTELIDLVFNDEIFNTGISHFTFNTKNTKVFPTLGFWKI